MFQGYNMKYPFPKLKTFVFWGVGESEVKVKSAQSYLSLCDPVDCSLPGFSVHENLQAKILEWVAISFSRGSSRPRLGLPGSPALQADALTSEPGYGIRFLSQRRRGKLTERQNSNKEITRTGSIRKEDTKRKKKIQKEG